MRGEADKRVGAPTSELRAGGRSGGSYGPDRPLGWLLPALLLAAVTVGAAGCRRPRTVPPRKARVSLSELVTLHPGWLRVRDLDRKLAQLTATVTSETAPFVVPPPVQLEAVDPALSALDAEQRQQMAGVIAERVKRDFDARAAQLRRRAARTERRALANALAEVEEQVLREREIYAAEYNGVARRYADQLGPLYLRLIALQPNLLDATFYPPDERVRRGEERTRIERQLDSLFAQRSEELKRLQTSHEAKLAALRGTAREGALARAREEGIRALAELESQRRVQQAQLEADLERTLQHQSDATPAPARELTAEHEGFARAVGALNREATEESRAQRAAQAEAIATLRRQRQALVALIQSATEAAAAEVAAERHFRLEFTPGAVDRELTRWVAQRLRERWPRVVASAGSLEK